MARHERFCKRLARLEASGGRGRSEQQPAIIDETVGDSEAQRNFGSDDGEIDLLVLGERPGRFRVREINSRGPSQSADSRISRRGNNFPAVTFRGEPRDQCVLARAAAEDQNSHGMRYLWRLTGLHATVGGWEYFVDLAVELRLESAFTCDSLTCLLRADIFVIKFIATRRGCFARG